MIKIELNKAQYDLIVRNFDQFKKSLKYKQPLKAAGDLIVKEADRNFEVQGALYQGGGFKGYGKSVTTISGKPWKPLAQSTREQRKRLGFKPARPILERTGKLRKGTKIKSVSNSTLTVHNKVSYAKYHQQDEPGNGKIPQRRVLGFSNKTPDAIRLIFDNFIVGQIRRFLK